MFQVLTQTIHGTGIFTYIYHKNQPNVGKYTIHGWTGLVYTVLQNTSLPKILEKPWCFPTLQVAGAPPIPVTRTAFGLPRSANGIPKQDILLMDEILHHLG